MMRHFRYCGRLWRALNAPGPIKKIGGISAVGTGSPMEGTMRPKHRRICLLWVLFAVTACSQAPLSGQATSTPETTPILGVWRAQIDGLPFVTLTVTNEGGRLSGAVLFYLLRRDEKGTASSSPGIP